MTKRYKVVRIPEDAFKELKSKQDKMNKVLSDMTAKPQNVPLTNIIRVVAKRPIVLEDKELVKMVRVKKIK